MEYLSYVCQSSSLLPWPPSLGGYNLLQLRPHLWMNVISPQRCFLGRKVYQDSQHMKGEGIQEKICLSSWGLYPLFLRKVPRNLPVIKRLWCHFLQNLAPSKMVSNVTFFGLAVWSSVGKVRRKVSNLTQKIISDTQGEEVWFLRMATIPASAKAEAGKGNLSALRCCVMDSSSRSNF